MPKAVIVGAGINGLSSAWALLRAGWQVEVLEAGPIPNPKAASTDHHRLIRSQYSDPGYAARIPEAFAAWERMWGDLGARHYMPRGMLALSRAPGDWTERSKAALEANGQPMQLLAPEEVARRFEVFETADVRFGLLTEDGGALLAERILRGLATWLTASGATLRDNTPVLAVDPVAGTVTTPSGEVGGDVVIVAAGTASGLFNAELRQTCHARRVTVLYVEPPKALQAAWERAPCWVDLGLEDDLWGMPVMEGWPAKLGYGTLTVPGDTEADRTAPPEDVLAVTQAYAARLVGAEEFTLVRPHVNFYLMAPEERFQLLAQDRALFVSADSGHGFKFGALTGEDVAEAVQQGNVAEVARRMAGRAQGVPPPVFPSLASRRAI